MHDGARHTARLPHSAPLYGPSTPTPTPGTYKGTEVAVKVRKLCSRVLFHCNCTLPPTNRMISLFNQLAQCASVRAQARPKGPAKHTAPCHGSRRNLTHPSAAHFTAPQIVRARSAVPQAGRHTQLWRTSGTHRMRRRHPAKAPNPPAAVSPPHLHILTSFLHTWLQPHTPCPGSSLHTPPTAPHSPALPYPVPAGLAARAQCGQRPAPQAHAAGGAVHEQVHAQVRRGVTVERWSSSVCASVSAYIGMRVGTTS